MFPILCQARLGDYSTGGVPTSYLITADGKVAWHGHPNDLDDDLLETELKEVEKAHRVSTWSFMIRKALPEIPDKLSAVLKALDAKKFGKALKDVESKLAKLEDEDADAGETIRAWIAGRAERTLEEAATHVREDRIYRGYLLYGVVEEEFKGHDFAKQAKAAAKALKSDKAYALEIKASEKLEAIKKEMAEERKPEDKLKCLKPLLSKKYKETAAGKEAAKIAEELEPLVD